MLAASSMDGRGLQRSYITYGGWQVFQDWSPHLSFILKGSWISALQLKRWFKSKTSIQEYRNANTQLILSLCMNYMVHVSRTMWRIENQPSNFTSCSDNALRLLVLVAEIVFTASSEVFVFKSGLRSEGLFWERYILKVPNRVWRVLKTSILNIDGWGELRWGTCGIWCVYCMHAALYGHFQLDIRNLAVGSNNKVGSCLVQLAVANHIYYVSFWVSKLSWNAKVVGGGHFTHAQLCSRVIPEWLVYYMYTVHAHCVIFNYLFFGWLWCLFLITSLVKYHSIVDVWLRRVNT